MLGVFLYLMISLVLSSYKYYLSIIGVIFFLFMLILNLNTMKKLMKLNKIFYLDNLSFFLVMLTLLVILYLIYSNKVKEMYMMLSLFSMFSFSVSSILKFYMFFELSIIPILYLMLMKGNQPERLQAGVYMILYTLLGSLPLLLSILYLSMDWKSNWSLLSSKKFEMMYNFSWSFFLGWWSFFLVLGFLMKLPVYGFHLWLPKAHVEAPTGGSVMLAGVLLKLGSYGLLRMQSIVVYHYLVWWDFCVGFFLMGMVYVSLICYRLYDYKMLMAYSSVVHMTLLASGVSQNLSVSFFGGVILSLTHGLCSSGLFSGFGKVYEVLGTRQMFNNGGFLLVGGVFKFLWFFYCFMKCSLPPSLNFVGELLLFWSGYLLGGSWLLFICGLSVFLSGLFCLFLFIWLSWGKSSNFVKYRLLNLCFSSSFYLVIFSFLLMFFMVL